LTLRPHELAFLLQVPRAQIVDQINRGELRNASRDTWNRIAFEDALELIRERVESGRCSPLAELLAEEIQRGRLRVSRAEAEGLSLEAALSRMTAARRSRP
jgi:hypothetical protein